MVELTQPTPDEGAKLASQAIPLDSPVAQALRDFTGRALTSRCVAMVAFAMTEQGQVTVARVSPGGLVQCLGLIKFGEHMLLSSAVPAVQQ